MLLAAALDEFAAKGYAGARVQEIADRAGVNKQLINYYFGGKEGLYAELRRTWLERKAGFAGADLDLAEVTRGFLHDALTDPRQLRLLVWRALSECGPPDVGPGEDQFTMAQRKARGEIAAELDPASVRLLLMSAVIMPAVMPGLVRSLFDLDPADPEFERRYADQLGKIIARLA